MALHLIVRSVEGLSLLGGPPFDSALGPELNRIACTGSTFSKDGSKLAVVTPAAVVVYDPVSCKEIQSLALDGVSLLEFSPCGTYIQAFQKPRGQEKNAGIWELATGSAVLHFLQRNVTKSNWPIIQFSDDETVACRIATNDVQIFDATDFSKGIVDHLRLPGVQGVRLSLTPPSFLSTYVPESKGQPAVVRIHDRVHCGQSEAAARKSFFKSSSVNMMWNHGSTALLVLAMSDDDKSNQSYYGETRLHYLRSDGSQEGTVPLNKEGPIHDAQWSPTGKEFIVIYGYMPAKATLFDLKCRPVFEFGIGPYNTIRWNPFGAFICLAGFGNLPGDMSIWDRETSKLLGKTKSPCSVTCEWSPDGRLLMTASTAPRLQVDNGIKIFKYNGALIHEKKIDKLYQADWRPGQYISRPASPNSFKAEAQQQGTTGTAKPAGYRPPNSSMSAAVREKLFGEEKSGGEISKSALKNKKRREKLKQKADEAEPLANPPNVDTLEVLETSTQPVASADDASKKLRALNKKLRQIEELKAKLDGQAPSEAQKIKLDQEASLLEEIRQLQM